jgi:hypothetical protein
MLAKSVSRDVVTYSHVVVNAGYQILRNTCRIVICLAMSNLMDVGLLELAQLHE